MTLQSSSPPTKLLRFRLVQALEDKILLQSWRLNALPPGAVELVDLVSKELFDNTYAETMSAFPAGTEPTAEKDENSQYETDTLSDDGIAQFFLPLGLDFRDNRGHPLRSTIFLARQAEAACRGIVGRVPTQEEAGERDWAEQLQTEAKQFMRRKTA